MATVVTTREFGGSELVFYSGNYSGTGAAFQDLVNTNVRTGEVWEIWSVVLSAGVGSGKATFKLQLGDQVQTSDLILYTTSPAYIPFPDNFTLEPTVPIKIQVKSDGSTTVSVYAFVVGRRRKII